MQHCSGHSASHCGVNGYVLVCSDAWLGLLQLPLPTQLLKQVLVQLHTRVMPALPNPLLLADFLTSCLDQGGMLGILALNGIFTLVTKHGLEYSAFYARLYALLQASLKLVLKPTYCGSAVCEVHSKVIMYGRCKHCSPFGLHACILCTLVH